MAKSVVLKKFTRNAMKLNRFKIILAAAVFGALGVSSFSHAQFVWLDDKGVKQYSDMPPPASVPQKRILKQPGSPSTTKPSAPTEPAADQSSSAASQDKASFLPMTTAEKNADFQKRRAEQAEKERKAAEEAQLAAAKAKNCEHARMYQRVLQSGERVARTDKNGERYFLDDQQRAKEAQDAKRVVDACK
jgi:hypothetical protein